MSNPCDMTRPNLLPLCLSSLLLVSPVRAVTALWDGSTGNWTDSSKWSTPTFPTNGSADAEIDAGVVTLNQTVRVLKLNLDSNSSLNPTQILGTSGFTLEADQRFTWDGYAALGGNMILKADGGITFQGSQTKLLGYATAHSVNLQNNATTSVSNGTIAIAGGSKLTNNSTFNVTGTFAFSGAQSGAVADGTFINNGTLSKSGSGNSLIRVPFENNGTVNVSSGELSIFPGEDTSGTYTSSGSGELSFVSRSLKNGTSIGGTGKVTFSSGSSTLDGAFFNPTTTRIEGTVDINQFYLMNKLELAGGVRRGSGNIIVNGTFQWTDGDFFGNNTNTINGTATISGSLKSIGGTTSSTGGSEVIFTGNTTQSSTIRIANFGAKLTNTGTYEIANNAIVQTNSGGGTTGRFVNEGTFRFNSPFSSGRATVNALFDNDDTVDILRGTLKLKGGSDSGDYVLGGRFAELEFNGGTRTLEFSSTVTGEGDVTFSSGTTTISSLDYDLDGVTSIRSGNAVINSSSICETREILQTGGQRLGNSLLTASGQFQWLGGTLGTSSRTSATGVRVSGDQQKILANGATVTNLGTGTGFLDGTASIEFGGATSLFLNFGSFEALSNAGMTAPAGGDFRNADPATFTKSTPGTTTTMEVDVLNAGAIIIAGGTLDLDGSYTQIDGSLRLAGGDLTTTSALDLQAGSLNGSGTITGSATMGSSAEIAFDLGGTIRGTSYDAIDFTGVFTQSGTLTVNLTNGFLPVSGATFDLWNAGSTAGSFSTITLPSLPGSLTWDTTNLASAGQITVTGSAPTYAEFVTFYGLTGSQADDDDGDSLSNGLEFQLGTSPVTANADSSRTFTNAGTTTTISIVLPAVTPGDAELGLQSSSDLTTGSWSTFATRPSGGIWSGAAVSLSANGFVTVTASVVSTDPNIFIRFFANIP